MAATPQHPDMDKNNGEAAFTFESVGPNSNQLTSSHREYLLQRHGTLNLKPVPSQDPADPLNWPAWKKNLNLFMVSLHTMVAAVCCTGPIPAIEIWAHLYQKTPSDASYLVSVVLAMLGIGPLVFAPLSNTFGRRPVWILTIFCAMLLNIGVSFVQSYGGHIALRILIPFFLSPPIALGGAVVAETFFASQWAAKLGHARKSINSDSIPGGPFLMGFVVEHLSWRWMYRIFAIVLAAELIVFIVLSPESLYIRTVPDEAPTATNEPRTRRVVGRFRFRQINPKKLTVRSFLEPLFLLGHVKILVATISYAMVFNWVLVLLMVEVSPLYGVYFHLNAQQIGINYLSFLVGSILGEQVGSRLCEFAHRRRVAHKTKAGKTMIPEDRLIFAQIGFPTIIAGIVIFFVQVAKATEGKGPHHWNITPDIGIALAGFGAQIVTTTIFTYCIDVCPKSQSASVGTAINFVRLEWSFVSFCGAITMKVVFY
ncbi:uncharacterized protein A1O9_04712 [Exophiala aquamarina CBS 119918]|uniref:Major facilitator superfamily (MFS) profile domain-containing protein n=1 Tax=Exophiala aquamarina CBS 119918 TaxID=1182545 RepID=A0A072PID6_9EURO|nr:uncharacterized protein A1O9_04712 [Exophiala aquamarina CBS 119918]KEF59864.1 hypothetical protein A1O9_04712 [Exophiala aquamarina CBS 119918]